MPFRLKNSGATYQKVMVTLFHDMIHKEIEIYVDDMIAKSWEGESHIANLKNLFERLKKNQLKLNPSKCTFGVTFRKLLGFIVSSHEIEVDLAKIKAIQDLLVPRTENEVRGFIGRLNYIFEFISHLMDKCDPIFKLLKKHAFGDWDEDCQKTFDRVKEYLSNPLILVHPIPRILLILYLAIHEKSMGRVLG